MKRKLFVKNQYPKGSAPLRSLFKKTFMNKNLLSKLLWSIAPIGWGAFTWFIAFGPGSSFIPFASSSISCQISFLIRTLLAFGLIILFFKDSFEDARKNNKLKFFGFLVPLPAWYYLMALVIAGILISFAFRPIWEYEVINSLILGVLISSCVEEFITRSFFVKYKMGWLEFLEFNIISSISFLLMHAGYSASGAPLANLFTGDRFVFSLIMGLLVYKTQRIEIAIILHMLMNFLCWTLPVCILKTTCGSVFYYPILFLIVIGCFYDEIQKIALKIKRQLF